MRIIRYALSAVLAATTCVGADPLPPDGQGLIDKLVAHARTVRAEDHAYTRTVRTESIEAGKTEERVVMERYDPSRPSDQRWTFVSLNGQAPAAEQLQNYRKELPKRRQAYYGRVAGYFGKPATSAVDDRGRTILRLASLPKETVMVADADISANAKGELLVNASGAIPFVEEVRFSSTKPTRVKLVARIERFETTLRYRQMADGKPVPVELVSEMSGSMLTKEGRVRTRITYSDQRNVGR